MIWGGRESNTPAWMMCLEFRVGDAVDGEWDDEAPEASASAVVA